MNAWVPGVKENSECSRVAAYFQSSTWRVDSSSRGHVGEFSLRPTEFQEPERLLGVDALKQLDLRPGALESSPC